jgi:hypothetical protein
MQHHADGNRGDHPDAGRKPGPIVDAVGMSHATALFRVARQARQVRKNLAHCGEGLVPAPLRALGEAALGS